MTQSVILDRFAVSTNLCFYSFQRMQGVQRVVEEKLSFHPHDPSAQPNALASLQTFCESVSLLVGIFIFIDYFLEFLAAKMFRGKSQISSSWYISRAVELVCKLQLKSRWGRRDVLK